ncbi:MULTISPECIES: AIPR family protein [unclassified Pseudomonas]|uniref:AIPR family protein n=1 Tax=unclassified Pseudomonas TaxID=196821 RepID=UPI00089CC828|nr:MULTISPECIES: AIPR family protein [unclassified Pseudomonas]SDY34888.1 AIPR protein [Pseudomonas sp. NFACC08-1]SFM07458.1 AIPR protein [Pseudomonas sp. NFACC46-3]
MDLLTFHKDIIETVRSKAESSRDFIRTAFVEECGERLVEAEELLSFEMCRFEGVNGKRKRLRVDGYSFDDADNSMALLIAEFFNEDEVPSFITSDAKAALGDLRAFLEEALEGNLTDGSVDESQPGFGFACDLMNWHSKITKYRFYFVSDGMLKTRQKGWPEDAVSGTPVEFHIWDIGRFHSAYISATGRDDLVVDFSTNKTSGLKCLAAAESQGDYSAYLCMIPGDTLADIYDIYGSRLLEGNVRTFLSTKGKVNAAIQNTIRNQPEMFFAFNNGIAATAENVVIEEDAGGTRIRSAVNLQIVNGGQTTASLAFAKRGGTARKDCLDLSKVMVQMKLSVLPPEKAGELTPEIARYANSQNKVSDADFFSNHPFHIRLQEFSRRLFTSPKTGAQFGTHWFYERARGQYFNEQAKLTSAQKNHFLVQNPKNQLFTKTDVAKYENSWREQPHRVSMGAQKNFIFFADIISKSWISDGKTYNEEYFRSLVALAIIFRKTESLVSQQTWYQGGYRANIVTYSIAKLHNLISEDALGKQFNFRTIWDLQAVPQALCDQLSIIAEKVFLVLTDPDRPKDNVTEWAKMQACWEQVKNTKVKLVSNSDEFLQDVRLSVEDGKKSKTMQKTDDGIQLQIMVVDLPGAEWTRLLNWGIKKGKLSPKQVSLLSIATQIPHKLPTERQCIELWKLRGQMIEDGYLAL